MIFSAAYPMTYKGKPAQMRVVRNDGFCWGRMVLKTGREYDVPTKRDHYERNDDTAAQSFINAAKRGGVEPPMASWRMGWSENEPWENNQ